MPKSGEASHPKNTRLSQGHSASRFPSFRNRVCLFPPRRTGLCPNPGWRAILKTTGYPKAIPRAVSHPSATGFVFFRHGGRVYAQIRGGEPSQKQQVIPRPFREPFPILPQQVCLFPPRRTGLCPNPGFISLMAGKCRESFHRYL